MATNKPLEPEQFLQVIPPPEVSAEIRFVVPAKYKVGALKALDDIRALFGKSGQNWITDSEHTHCEAGERHPRTGERLNKAFDGYCLIGGVYEVDGRYEAIARTAISLAVIEHEEGLDARADGVEDTYDAQRVKTNILDGDTIIDFNDDRATWDDIKAVLKLAKKLVREAPTS